MTAYEIPGGQFTLNAGADVEIRRFVKVNADGMCEHATSTTDPVVGVSYIAAKDTQPVSIISEGLAMVEAGATLAPGDRAIPAAAGKAGKGSTAGYVVITGGNAGDLVTIKL